MKSIIFLDAVLSTKIVTIAYWVLLLANLFVGLGLIGMGSSGENNNPNFSSDMMIFAGICILILGSIFIRLWAEFMVVMFKIQQNTRRTAELLNNLEKNNIPL
jgi:hypothetical protein